MKDNKIKDYTTFAKKYIKNSKKKNLFLLKFLLMIKKQLSLTEKINSWGKNVFVKVPYYNSKVKII